MLNLGQKVVEIKTCAALDFGRQLLRCRNIHPGSNLLDQRQDIPHAEDASCVPLGIKNLQTIKLLTGTGKLDGRTRDLAHGQSRTTTRIAIEFGQDDAGQWQGFFESFGGIDRVLALHGIDHKEGFDRIQRRMQVLDFTHQGFVNRQAACSVHQQHIKEVLLGVVQRRKADINRLLVRCAGEPLGTSLGCHRFELLDGGRAINVTRDRQHFLFPLLNQVFGQLGGGRCFTRALQSSHQNDCWRLRSQVDIANSLPHGGCQFFVDDAHQHLAGLQ